MTSIFRAPTFRAARRPRRTRWGLAPIVTLLAASAALGPAAAASAATKPKTKIAGKAGESLKLVVKPAEVSLTEALHNEFFVEVSGHSSKHAQLEVFLEAETKHACAANEPTEAETEGVYQQNPAQSIPGGNVEKYPTTLDTNFTGSFDWDSNTLFFEKSVVKPGTKLICAYLTPPEAMEEIQPTAEEKRIAEENETGVLPKRVPVKPLLSAHTSLKVIDGKVPKGDAKGAKGKKLEWTRFGGQLSACVAWTRKDVVHAEVETAVSAGVPSRGRAARARWSQRQGRSRELGLQRSVVA